MSKKAQGISINVIIVAVIALLVLVVLMAIFGGRMGLFNNDLENQTNKSCPGKIVSFSEDCGLDYSVSMGAYTNVDPGYKCCIQKRIVSES